MVAASVAQWPPGTVPGAELRKALEGGTFPIDSYVLADTGQTEDHRLGSVNWRPATEELDVDPANVPGAAAVLAAEVLTEVRESSSHEAIRQRLREGTAYGTARTLISVLAAVAVLALVVLALLSLTMASGPAAMAVIIALALEVLATIAGAAFLQAMLDIADANLRRQT